MQDLLLNLQALRLILRVKVRQKLLKKLRSRMKIQK